MHYIMHLVNTILFLLLTFSSGYHTANSVILNGEEHMLVFGGLHRRAPTNSMEVYNIGKNMWTTEGFAAIILIAFRRSTFFEMLILANRFIRSHWSSSVPSLRTHQVLEPHIYIHFSFIMLLLVGCYCVSVYDLRSDSFIITGGSDGNDLWRNGRELKDVLRALFSISITSSNLIALYSITDPRVGLCAEYYPVEV